MSSFPIDVVEFVEARFEPREYAEIFKVLASDAFSSPKTMRAALFLADGDISLLRHYAKTCATDPMDVRVRAEFVIGVSQEPLCAVDFSELYLPGQAPAGNQPRPSPTPPARAPGRMPRARKPADEQPQHHQHLKDREFQLGNATYVVADKQPHPQYVHCYRKEGAASRMVRLPYVFVMDRLAERIELKSTDFGDI